MLGGKANNLALWLAVLPFYRNLMKCGSGLSLETSARIFFCFRTSLTSFFFLTKKRKNGTISNHYIKYFFKLSN